VRGFLLSRTVYCITRVGLPMYRLVSECVSSVFSCSELLLSWDCPFLFDSQRTARSRGSGSSSRDAEAVELEQDLKVVAREDDQAQRCLVEARAAMSDAVRDGLPVDDLKKGVALAEAQLNVAAARRFYIREQQSPTAGGGTLLASLRQNLSSAIGLLNKAQLAVAPSLSHLPGDETSLMLVVDACAASDQTAEKGGKRGPSCLPSAYYDPTPDGRLHKALLPSPADYEAHGTKLPDMSKWVLYKLNLGDVPEDMVGKKRSRDDTSFGGRITNFYKHHAEHVELQPTVEEMHLPSAFVTVRSKSDCVGGALLPSTTGGVGSQPATFVPLRVREYKRSSRACSDALPQAFALGTSIAVSLLQGGVPPSQVIVPVDVTNGRSMQFGAVYIACGSMPLCWTLSKELDLSVRRDVIEAHLHLCKVKEHMGTMVQGLRQRGYQVKQATPGLSSISRGIWSKPDCLTNKVYPELPLEASLHHVLSVLTALDRAGVHDCVCYPMGFAQATKPWSLETSWYAFFPDLTFISDDNPTSFTKKVPDGPTGVLFSAAFRAAVAMIHGAGVVHGDMYMSNVLWHKPADGCVQVKIIDWDTCFLIEDGIPDAWEKVWRTKSKTRGRYSRSKDFRELDLFMVRVVEWATSCEYGTLGRQLWGRLASAASAGASNACFRDIQELYLQECFNEELGFSA